MGPITLFDKSFLQSLSLDESVWFDHFFLTNVCPLFYVETMADLEKSPQKGRTAEDEVRIIAEKFPEMHGMPCAHHTELCTTNLLGRGVPMTGQVPLAGAQLVKTDGNGGIKEGEIIVFIPIIIIVIIASFINQTIIIIVYSITDFWRYGFSDNKLGKICYGSADNVGINIQRGGNIHPGTVLVMEKPQVAFIANSRFIVIDTNSYIFGIVCSGGDVVVVAG